MMDYDDEALRRSFDPYLRESVKDWYFVASDLVTAAVKPRKRSRYTWVVAAMAFAVIAVGGPAVLVHRDQPAGRGVGTIALPRGVLQVSMISPTNGWALGPHRTLYVTRDGGQAWSRASLGPHLTVTSSGSTTLWVLGPKRSPGRRFPVWRSTNMGRSWQGTTISLPWIPTKSARSAGARGILVVDAAAASPVAWVLDDAVVGNHWSLAIVALGGKRLNAARVVAESSAPNNQPLITGVTPISAAAGWADSSSPGPEGPAVFHVSHGTWVVDTLPLPTHLGVSGIVKTSPVPVESVQSPSSGVSFVAANYSPPSATGASVPILYRNTGHGWRSIWHGAPFTDLRDSAFINGRVGWIVVGSRSGNTLTVRRTTDGGQSWQTVSAPAKKLSSFGFSSKNNGWWSVTAGNRVAMWATTNGGHSWHKTH